jgi:hypothetical protein
LGTDFNFALEVIRRRSDIAVNQIKMLRTRERVKNKIRY